jgi:hypothetical protein
MTWTGTPASAAVQAGQSGGYRLSPPRSPFRQSTVEQDPAPINWQSKWRMPSVRRATRAPSAKLRATAPGPKHSPQFAPTVDRQPRAAPRHVSRAGRVRTRATRATRSVRRARQARVERISGPAPRIAMRSSRLGAWVCVPGRRRRRRRERRDQTFRCDRNNCRTCDTTGNRLAPSHDGSGYRRVRPRTGAFP